MWSLNIKFPIAPTTNEAYDVPCRQRTHSSVRISRGRPLSREGGDTLSTEEEKTFGLHWSNGRQAGRQAAMAAKAHNRADLHLNGRLNRRQKERG